MDQCPKCGTNRQGEIEICSQCGTKLAIEPFVSIHIPFYNEQNVANRILTACMSLDYDNYEVVVVDDSTDETVKILQQWSSNPKVKIIHRNTREGFKGGALNEAIKHMDPRAEYVMILDADFVPGEDIIKQFLTYFNIYDRNGNNKNELANEELKSYIQKVAKEVLDKKIQNEERKNNNNGEVAVVQGYQWHTLNASENWLTRGIRVEYSGSYMVERPFQEIAGLMKMISGSVYMIKADILRDFGWSWSITEDWELTLRLYIEGYKVVYTPLIYAAAECPSTFGRLIKQRMRWAEGHTFNVKKYFWDVLRSPNISRKEKIEFLYFAPYYMQSLFLLIGTSAWFTQDAILHSTLPFWAIQFGWALVFTNLFSLALMNITGIFLEKSTRKNLSGVFSCIVAGYVLTPFLAYSSLKGLFENREGGWVRTLKTGKITELILKPQFRKVIRKLLPKRKSKVKATSHNINTNRSSEIKIGKQLPIIAIIALLVMAVPIFSISALSTTIIISEKLDDQFYLHKTNATDVSVDPGRLMTKVIGNSSSCDLGWVRISNLDKTQNYYWYSDVKYPTGNDPGNINSGTRIFHFHYSSIVFMNNSITIGVQVGYCLTDGSNKTQLGSAQKTFYSNTGCASEDLQITWSGAIFNPPSNSWRLYLCIFYISGEGLVVIWYDQNSMLADTNLTTPFIVVPESSLLLLFLVPIIPVIALKTLKRKK